VGGINSEPGPDSAEGEAPWWTDRREVAAFARILIDAEQLGDCQNIVVSFFETPWAWDAQHAIWCETRRPDMGSPHEFDALVARLDAVLAN
jgi:hypothetical protein